MTKLIERKLGDYTAVVNKDGYVEYLINSDGYKVHVYKKDGLHSWTTVHVKLNTLRSAPDGRYMFNWLSGGKT